MSISSQLEQQCRTWAKPASETEDDKCQNAERAIRAAVKASEALKHRDIKIISQGSYKNNTNVRQDSDVDIGVVCYDSFFFDTTFAGIPGATPKQQLGILPAVYTYAQFRTDLETALLNHFPPGSVTVGNKHFDIKANTYRVEADVAPFFEHRRYLPNNTYLSGVELMPANNPAQQVINWPTQHYENGVIKNAATGGRFKHVVRVLKRVRNELEKSGASYGNGFLCECLASNVPNTCFNNDTLVEDVKTVILYLHHYTNADDKCGDWGEVSGLKYLFSPAQKWSRSEAHQFVDDAWSFLGLTP